MVIVILRGPGLLERLISISDVLGVEFVAIEDIVFAPLEDLGAGFTAAAGNETRASPEEMSSSAMSLIRDLLPRSPVAGSKTLSVPLGGVL